MHCVMMASSNGNIFRVAGHLYGEFTGHPWIPCVIGQFPSQRPVMRSFDIFFDLRLNKRLSNQSRGWWFETPSHSLWRHRNVIRNQWFPIFYSIAVYCSIEPRQFWFNQFSPMPCTHFVPTEKFLSETYCCFNSTTIVRITSAILSNLTEDCYEWSGLLPLLNHFPSIQTMAEAQPACVREVFTWVLGELTKRVTMHVVSSFRG